MGKKIIANQWKNRQNYAKTFNSLENTFNSLENNEFLIKYSFKKQNWYLCSNVQPYRSADIQFLACFLGDLKTATSCC